nr:energy-coupling factor transporter transmembrane component T [uncultured Caproiciproducens sp.]
MKNHFGRLHPAILFIYFASVILFSMFFMHPVFLAISFLSGFVCSLMLNSKKALGFNLKFLLPLILVMAIINPLLNHAGATILLYVNDNPITLESCIYGIAAACMFASVLLWFSCSNAVMTSDKITYLFGRAAPSFSLMFSMVLRFVPRFKAQILVISNAQKGIGKGADTGSIAVRAKNGIKILSMLTTWALENGITTADSMRARGYGLAGRTNFSRYKFAKTDKITLILLFVLLAVVIYGFIAGENNIRYFPSFSVKPVTPFSALIYAAYFLLCSFPLLIHAVFEVKYHGNH